MNEESTLLNQINQAGCDKLANHSDCGGMSTGRDAIREASSSGGEGFTEVGENDCLGVFLPEATCCEPTSARNRSLVLESASPTYRKPVGTTLLVGDSGELVLPEHWRRRWGLEPGAELVAEETDDAVVLRLIDPPLTRAYVEPTSRCNLSCRACVRNSWAEPMGSMDMSVYRRLVDELRRVPSLRSVAFWGIGEPLLHPDIAEMVSIAGELGVETELITNGLLLDRQMAGDLVAAGLGRLVVSLDGTSAHSHADARSGADLSQVLRNIEGLHASRLAAARDNPELGIEFVVMRRNIDELPDLHRLARRVAASFVVLTNVLPYTEDMCDETLYGRWAGKSFAVAQSRWNPRFHLPRLDVLNGTLTPVVQLLGNIGAIGHQQERHDWPGGRCRFVREGSVAVSWDGEVSPCVALMHSYRCYVLGREKQIKRYTLGNVGHKGIAEIWKDEEFREFRARVKRFDFPPCTDCGGCEMASSNETDCFGNPFPVCGDCLWAKGVIQCP